MNDDAPKTYRSENLQPVDQSVVGSLAYVFSQLRPQELMRSRSLRKKSDPPDIVA